MTPDKPNHRSVTAAAATATTLMLLIGLADHVLATRLGGSLSGTAITPAVLDRFPMQIGDWTGEDAPLDEKVVRRTGTDAHINRRYSHHNTQESASLYIACGVNVTQVLGHRPEICYARAGWALTRRDRIELSLDDGTKLPCTVLRFSRGYPATTTILVLHYYIVEGRRRADISTTFSDIGRRFATVDYVAQVQIVASSEAFVGDSATRLASAFAVDSATSIKELFEDIGRDRKGNSLCTPQGEGDHP
jgi:EpsI family protein